MLSYLELKNFKSFSNVFLDLRSAYDIPKKIVFIYGENGSGKSNLMSSVLFLLQTLNTFENQVNLRDLSEFNKLLNNSISDDRIRQDILQHMIHTQYFTLSNLVDDYKMLGNEQPMSLKFGFRIKGFNGSYFMKFTESKIIHEELRYHINEREGIIFSLKDNDITFSPSIFFDINYRKELIENKEKYWGKHTFMAILLNEINTKNEKYIKDRINSNILDVFDWLKKLSVWCKESSGEKARISIPLKFMQNLDKGTVKNKNNKELKLCEEVLNYFFTQLYSDIKKVFYVFTPDENKFVYELYFKKMIYGKLINIPVSLESTGTQKLLEIFPILLSSMIGASTFIDEIDSGIHDLLMKNLLENIEDSLEGQFIATTHNTLLMESLLPENTYIIRVNANGTKNIDCIADYKQRTQKNNSIQNKYLRGDYEGIPYVGNLDFKSFVSDMFNQKYHSSITEEDEEE